MSQNFRLSRGLLIAPGESGQNRMHLEQQKLREFFPHWEMLARDGRITAAVGTLRPTKQGTSYSIRIAVPAGYPYEIPTVYSDGWTPKSGTPHRYTETHLCLMRSAQWSSSFSLAFLVAKSAIWLGKYEVWCATARWPGNQQEHGSPAGSSFWREVRRFFDEL
jgi:hypothetical protein